MPNQERRRGSVADPPSRPLCRSENWARRGQWEEAILPQWLWRFRRLGNKGGQALPNGFFVFANGQRVRDLVLDQPLGLPPLQ